MIHAASRVRTLAGLSSVPEGPRVRPRRNWRADCDPTNSLISTVIGVVAVALTL